MMTDRPHVDHMAAADFRLAELKHTSSCPGCGSPEPARIEGRTCSECASFPKCSFCDRWVGDGSGWLPGYVNVLDGFGDSVMCCTVCFEQRDTDD